MLAAANGVPNGNSPYTPESATAGAMRQYRAIPFDMPDVEANAKANGRIMFDGERFALARRRVMGASQLRYTHMRASTSWVHAVTTALL